MKILPFTKPAPDKVPAASVPDPPRTREGLSLTIRLETEKILAAIAKLRKGRTE